MNSPQANHPHKARVPPGDSCGCAMSARFMAAALVGSSMWYGWRWYLGEASLGHTGLAILGWAFGAAFVGKLVGMAAYRLRASRPRRLRSASQAVR